METTTKRTDFWSVLADEMGSAGREEVATLEGAARFLYNDVDNAELRGQRKLFRELLAQAMREIDERTVGQPFRLEGPRGPLFVLIPLWRFAGCSGPMMGPGDGPKIVERPTWPRAARRAA